MQRRENELQRELLEGCLGAFVEAGSLEISLDRLAERVGTSKRMLIHHFGSRENLEERATALLEDRLRARFAPGTLPARATVETVLLHLWDSSTAPPSRGVLLLVMNLTQRAWGGSKRARVFYLEQQRLWEDLLLQYLPDREVVRDLLQAFQGALLAFLITGDDQGGRKMLRRFCSRVSAKAKQRRGAALR
ncbi:MAG: TetR/AcrR family transcriptional regulator [Edaphobacter sp.]|uniref:TetR/AcrR family transcriptional regulator n=1 Tax=Edaphobacter sp. TaxID=1934404 RepID=UPI002384004E|nr:TetR/AcrR family transcriptional regulator [Edaphobacter sp.]MDE1177994.1 TetR/AcrR family transcriptional regulator [Edaphobacter sp.]